MEFTHSIQRGYVEIKFDGKPDDKIRSALKANGFRWSPSALAWWRTKVVGSADFLGWLENKLHPEVNYAPCWKCNDPSGRLRHHDASSPCYCDACELEHIRADPNRRFNFGPDIDRMVEDDNARLCGV